MSRSRAGGGCDRLRAVGEAAAARPSVSRPARTGRASARPRQGRGSALPEIDVIAG